MEPVETPVLARQRYRVQMADSDAAQMMYFATPYRWHNGLFCEWLVQIGHPLGEMVKRGFGFPLVASSAQYVRPLVLDDEVELQLVVTKVGRTSFSLRMDAVRLDGDLALSTTLTHVWHGPVEGGAPASQPLPAWLRAPLEQHQDRSGD